MRDSERFGKPGTVCGNIGCQILDRRPTAKGGDAAVQRELGGLRNLGFLFTEREGQRNSFRGKGFG